MTGTPASPARFLPPLTDRSSNDSSQPLDDAASYLQPDPLSPFSPSTSIHRPQRDEEQEADGQTHDSDQTSDSNDSNFLNRQPLTPDEPEGAETEEQHAGSAAAAHPALRQLTSRPAQHAAAEPLSFDSRDATPTAMSPAMPSSFFPPPLMPPSPLSDSRAAGALSFSPRKQHPSLVRVKSNAEGEGPVAAAAAAKRASVSPLSSPTSKHRLSSKHIVHSRAEQGKDAAEPTKPGRGSHSASPSLRPTQPTPESRRPSLPTADGSSDHHSALSSPLSTVSFFALSPLYSWRELLSSLLVGCLKALFPFYETPAYFRRRVHHTREPSRGEMLGTSQRSTQATRPAESGASTGRADGPSLSPLLGLEEEYNPHRVLDDAQREEVMRATYLQGNRLMYGYICCQIIVSYVIAIQMDAYVQTTIVSAAVLAASQALLRLCPYHRLTRCLIGMASQGLVIMNVYHTDGIVEMEYGFFVTFTVMIIYQDWQALWPACALVIGDYAVEISLAAADADTTGFFDSPELYTRAIPIATHVIMLLFQVCICCLWCNIEQYRTLRDAVQRMRLVEERKQAQKASAAKSDFLSTMSHEIRTPMNGVLGMIELMLETPLSAEQLEYAETVRSSGQSLLSIINDILDFSKVEADKLTLEHIPMNLHRVCEVVCDLMANTAADKGLEFVMRYEPTAPRFIIADPGRIRQICLNLLGNAFKFTHAGYVILNVELVDADWEARRGKGGGMAAGAAGRAEEPKDGSLFDPLDPLALPGLSDIIEVESVSAADAAPLSPKTEAIHAFTRRHMLDTMSLSEALKTAPAGPPPTVAATAPPVPPSRLFTRSSKAQGIPAPSALSRGSSQSPTPSQPRLLLRISCIDSGIGLQVKQVERIFDPFTQADSSTSRKYGGSGLGLAICRRLCNLMGGELSVHSRIKDGSTFAFTLPVELDAEAVDKQTKLAYAMEKAKALANASRSADQQSSFPRSARTLPISSKRAPPGSIPNVELLSGCRVLLVDTRPLSLSVLCEMLDYHGAQVTIRPQQEQLRPSASGETSPASSPPAINSGDALYSALAEWSACHLNTARYYHTLLIDADGIGMDILTWQQFVSTWQREESRRARDMEQEVSPTNTTLVLLVTPRQKRRYEEAVQCGRVVYLLKPFREPAIIRVLTTPHTMANTRRYDHPSRTSYAVTSMTAGSHSNQTPTLPHAPAAVGAAAAAGVGLGSARASHAVGNSLGGSAYSRRPSLVAANNLSSAGSDSSWYIAGHGDGDAGDAEPGERGGSRTPLLSLYSPPPAVFRRPSLAMQPMMMQPQANASPILGSVYQPGNPAAGRRVAQTSSHSSSEISRASSFHSTFTNNALANLQAATAAGSAAVPESLVLANGFMPHAIAAGQARGGSSARPRASSSGQVVSETQSGNAMAAGEQCDGQGKSHPPAARQAVLLPVMARPAILQLHSSLPNGAAAVQPVNSMPPPSILPPSSASSTRPPSSSEQGSSPAPELILPPAAALPRAVSVVAGRRILLVEDTPLNQKVATRMMEKMGCIVSLACDGKVAVEHVRQHRQQVDLIFMDIVRQPQHAQPAGLPCWQSTHCPVPSLSPIRTCLSWTAWRRRG